MRTDSRVAARKSWGLESGVRRVVAQRAPKISRFFSLPRRKCRSCFSLFFAGLWPRFKAMTHPKCAFRLPEHFVKPPRPASCLGSHNTTQHNTTHHTTTHNTQQHTTTQRTPHSTHTTQHDTQETHTHLNNTRHGHCAHSRPSYSVLDYLFLLLRLFQSQSIKS